MNNDDIRLQEGRPQTGGAQWDGKGTNFALFSAHATKVELCLFDESAKKETHRIVLPEYTDQIWHGYLKNVRPGTTTAIEYTGHMNRSVGIGSTRTSSCSILMQADTTAS